MLATFLLPRALLRTAPNRLKGPLALTGPKTTRPEPELVASITTRAMTSDASAPVPPTSRLEVLAQLQDLDVRLEQIDHRVAHLPEREVRAGIDAELTTLASEMNALDASIGDLARQQRRHEDEVARIESKRAQNSERLYESHMTSPKEAEALTAEADALGRRQLEIEDLILELMEQLEPLNGERDGLGRRQAEAQTRGQGADAAIEAAEREARAERDGVLAEREALVASADQDLVAVYEQRRTTARGEPVVGRLIGTTCSACHLEVPSVDYERITRLAPDQLAECPQCGALLVR